MLRELHLDELSTFVQSKKRQTWVLAAIEVRSRLWPATLVGARTYRDTLRSVRSTSSASDDKSVPRAEDRKSPACACYRRTASSRPLVMSTPIGAWVDESAPA